MASGPQTVSRLGQFDKGEDATSDRSDSVKKHGVQEKSALSSDMPDVGEGEVVAIDKEGNVEIFRESDFTPEEYKKLLGKIDRFLLHLMWFCYGVQQADKISIGTQAI